MSNFEFENDSDSDSDFTPRERRTRARTSPLRFVSPGTFGLAAVLFFLPWTDLGCSGPGGKMQFVTQSGLQSATGGYSEGDALQDMRKKAGGKAGPGNDLNLMPGREGKKGTKDGPDKAHLLWLYLALVLAGAGVPVAIAADKLRGAVVAGFAGGAILVLGIQLAIGLPLPKAAAESNEEMKKMEGMKPAGAPGGGDLDKLGQAKFTSAYLVSFWLSAGMLLVSLGLGVIQLVLPGSTDKKKTKRRRPKDDDEDDDT